MIEQDIEKVKFLIGLSSLFWNKRPEYDILIDGISYSRGFIDTNIHEIKEIKFEVDLVEGDHLLEIKLLNKSDEDVVQDKSDPNNSKIIKDMLLNIEVIEIDAIEIKNCKWTKSKFVAEDSSRETLEGCVNLGWNGSYQIKFESPVYLWLLENL